MKLKILIKDENAIMPSLANQNDVGLDLVAIKKYKTLRDGVKLKPNTFNVGETILYDTGLSCMPSEGYYTEIVPRSSLSKTGWILSNSVGIIDPEYIGNILISLTRVDPTAPEIEIPFCKTQLIVKIHEMPQIEQVNTINTTSRGSGGFGSTGNRTK